MNDEVADMSPVRNPKIYPIQVLNDMDFTFEGENIVKEVNYGQMITKMKDDQQDLFFGVYYTPEQVQKELFRAVINNKFEDTLYWISFKPDLNVQDKYHNTLLMRAIKNQNINIINALFYFGASTGVKYALQGTPLHVAISVQNKNIVKMLLKKNANPNSPRLSDGKTSLHAAVDSCSLDIVKMVLDYHADVNIKDRKGENALHTLASVSINTDPGVISKIAEVLIEYKINVNELSNKKFTPFHLAVKNSNKVLVKALLLSGAAVDIPINGKSYKEICTENMNLYVDETLNNQRKFASVLRAINKEQFNEITTFFSSENLDQEHVKRALTFAYKNKNIVIFNLILKSAKINASFKNLKEAYEYLSTFD